MTFPGLYLLDSASASRVIHWLLYVDSVNGKMAKRSSRARGGQPRRVPVSTKILPSLRDQLEAASLEDGRTLGNEIERRLERSFRERELMEDHFGGARILSVLETIAQAWRLIEIVSRQEFSATSDNVLMAQEATRNILSLLKNTSGEDQNSVGHLITSEARRKISVMTALVAVRPENMTDKLIEDLQQAGNELRQYRQIYLEGVEKRAKGHEPPKPEA